MKAKHPSNIVLIGMPGAGKSTIGIILAKQRARDFVDTDVLIQVAEKRSLQEILDAEGYLALRQVEEHILLSLNCTNHVIATGGSAVYSPTAMNHLKANGIAVFLHVEMEELIRRITNFETRGIACNPDQTFAELYQERQLLYERYADLTIDCAGKSLETISTMISNNVFSYSSQCSG